VGRSVLHDVGLPREGFTTEANEAKDRAAILPYYDRQGKSHLLCSLNMKRAFSFFLLAELCLSPLLALPVRAASLSPGDLIKGPGEAVYYYAANGKRLVFPTSKVFFSWYSDFSTVKTLTASELAAIGLGGNVTYRPGVKMVKITTDSRTYAVASGGTLRWIETEQAAKDLYGADWNTKIDDVADTFFINYTAGASIKNASDYQPALQTEAAININTDKKISGDLTTPPVNPNPNPTTPTSTSPTPVTGQVTLSASRTTLQPGDILGLIAQASDSTGITQIELFFDGILIKRCEATVSCSGETQVPTSGTKTSYEVKAIARSVNQNVYTQQQNLLVETGVSSKVEVTLGQETIRPNQAASVTVTIQPDITISHVDISVNGIIVKSCTDGSRLCLWSDYVYGSIGQTMPVFAKVTDTLGRIYNSKVLTLTIGSNDSPSVVVSPAKTQIYVGETLDVTVTASDNDGISSIRILKDGVILKTCSSAQPCTIMTGPWNTTSTTLLFSGSATDALGLMGSSTAMQAVTVIAK